MIKQNDPAAAHFALLNDEELQRIIHSRQKEYTAEALTTARVEAVRRGNIPIPESKVKEEDEDKPDSIDPGISRPVRVPRSARIWAGMGFIWSIIYLTVGLIELQQGDGLSTIIGWSCLADCLLFSGGGLLAWTGRFSGARACWIIGGISALPLGAVMLFGAGQLKKVQHELNLGSKSRYVEVDVLDRPDNIVILENMLTEQRIDFFLEGNPDKLYLGGRPVRLMVAAPQADAARRLVAELAAAAVELPHGDPTKPSEKTDS